MKATLFLFLFAFSLAVFSQDNRIFKFNGTVYDKSDGKPLEGYIVDVYEKNTVIQTIPSEKKGKFNVDFSGGKEYTLEIFKGGYYSKRVVVRTNVPEDVKKLEPMKFEVELLRKSDYEDLERTDAFATSVLDMPYVIFEYNEKLEDLHYREDYTKNIKKKYSELSDSK